jgi:hypothetical protein
MRYEFRYLASDHQEALAIHNEPVLAPSNPLKILVGRSVMVMIRRVGAHPRGDVRSDCRLGELCARRLEVLDDILNGEGAVPALGQSTYRFEDLLSGGP